MAFTRDGLHSSGAGVIPHHAHDIGIEATLFCLGDRSIVRMTTVSRQVGAKVTLKRSENVLQSAKYCSPIGASGQC